MILKQVIKYDNAVAIEATWVDENDVKVKVTAYSGDQMDLFRADVTQYGGNIDDYETLIAEIETDFVPEPQPDPQIDINAEARAYLNSTDWMVQRHKDQLELGISTSLTPEEYNKLLQDRQEARDRII